MNTHRMSYKLKVHLFFAGGLLLVLVISIAMSLSSGQAIASALLGALSQIRPVEYGMYFAFWFWLARTTLRTPFTSLNQRGSKT